MGLNKLFSVLTDVRSVPAANAAGTARINIPPVGRIMNIKGQVVKGAALATLDDMRKAIREVRFILGTEVVRRWSFAQIAAVLEANGYPVENGMFDYIFAEAWRALVTDEEVLAVDVRRYTTIALELDIVNDATPLEFTFDYEYDELPKIDDKGNQIAGIIGHTRQTENLGGGEPVFKLDPLNGALQRMHIIVPVDVDVNRIRVLQGDTAIYDRWNTATRPGIRQQLKEMGMRIPANFVEFDGTFKIIPVVFDNNQQIRRALTDTAGLKIQLNLSAACAVKILRETQLNR